MEGNIVNVASFKLLFDGNELSDELLMAIKEVTFEDEINLPAMFIIKLNIVNFMQGTWRGIDLESFKPGDTVKLSMGMDSAVEIMTGEITALDLTFSDTAFLEIRGYDKLHRLRFGTMRRSFTDMKDSDIASSIASEVGLTPESEDSQKPHPYIFQNDQSNYEFLLERSKRIGFEMLVNNDDFIFRKSQEDKTPELTLEYGVDLDSFSVQIETLTQGSQVEVRGWDIKKKEEITSTVSSGSENTKMAGRESGYSFSESAFGSSSVCIVDDMITDTDEARNIAKAKYNLMLKEFISGEGECMGNPGIRAGMTLEIKGFGERISGIYYVISTVHSIKEGLYTTTFKVRRTGI
jgi:phage protein D